MSVLAILIRNSQRLRSHESERFVAGAGTVVAELSIFEDACDPRGDKTCSKLKIQLNIQIAKGA